MIRAVHDADGIYWIVRFAAPPEKPIARLESFRLSISVSLLALFRVSSGKIPSSSATIRMSLSGQDNIDSPYRVTEHGVACNTRYTTCCKWGSLSKRERERERVKKTCSVPGECKYVSYPVSEITDVKRDSIVSKRGKLYRFLKYCFSFRGARSIVTALLTTLFRTGRKEKWTINVSLEFSILFSTSFPTNMNP